MVVTVDQISAQVRATARRLIHDSHWAGWNPLALSGTELPSAVLLLAKLATVCFLLVAWRKYPAPYLPFIPALDHLPLSPVLIQRGMQLVLLGAAIALLCNRRVRTAALVLGVGMVFAMMASRGWFENNRTYLACLFILVGLTPAGRDRTPWLLRAQVIVLYFGAGLNKLLDPDWRSGQFFAYWITQILHYHPLIWLNSWLPNNSLWLLMGWGTICGELGLAATFLLLPRLRPAAMVVGVLFHTALLVVAGSSFGMFFYLAPISYFAFVTWPTSPARMLYDGDCGICDRTRRFFERLDVDRLVRWVPGQSVPANELPRGVTREALAERVYFAAGNTVAGGYAAFKRLLAQLSITYFMVLVLLIGTSSLRVWIAVSLLIAISPIGAPIGERVYALVARNRHRLGSPACALPTPQASRASNGARDADGRLESRSTRASSGAGSYQ